MVELICEVDGEPEDYQDTPILVRCKNCENAVLTTKGEVKYCKLWQGDEDGSYGGDPLYLDGDFYCAAGSPNR